MATKITTIAVEETVETELLTETETETVETVGVETFPPENNQVENMVYTLPLMGKGMLGIFMVTVIIIASVAILNKVTSPKKKD